VSVRSRSRSAGGLNEDDSILTSFDDEV
jgi:hypothetical protein